MNQTLISQIFAAIPELTTVHAPTSHTYKLLSSVLKKEVAALFSDEKFSLVDFGMFGQIGFPFKNMGNITTLDILNLDEFLIFYFYWLNKDKYKKVADLGANLGLHSIILDKCGYEVHAYEPDAVHYNILQENLALNSCRHIITYNQAVSTHNENVEFIRVLGNTTASHISGAKANPYGELVKYSVPCTKFAAIMEWADLIKCDIEGHEKEIFVTTTAGDWVNTDALVEVESAESAQILFDHFTKIGVHLFAQKINWQKVESLTDMPCSYRDGTLFISLKERMPW